MGANVFANGREVSAKKSDNQSIAAMPDVCLSPPSPPAGPLPIPYPNFSSASDTSDGTKTVKIAGDEVGMKDQSNYKTSKGDEAATRSLGMGVMTATIQGKTYFAAWSSDVMFEGANAVRFMDMTTHNHASQSANTQSTTASLGSADASPPKEFTCQGLVDENGDAREELSNKTKDKTLVGTDGKCKGTTVSSAGIADGEGSYVLTGHSRGKAAEKLPNRFVTGGDPADRAAGTTNLCDASKHQHAPPTMQKSGHAEARIFDDPKGPAVGAKVLLNIDWIPKTGEPSKMPCEDCHKLLCAASKDCQIKIFLCNDKNEPQDLNPHCPASAKTYESLKTAMGEGE